MITCTACEGKGCTYDGDDDDEVFCEECDGTGEVEEPLCSRCHGSGLGMSPDNNTSCWACGGSGVARQMVEDDEDRYMDDRDDEGGRR